MSNFIEQIIKIIKLKKKKTVKPMNKNLTSQNKNSNTRYNIILIKNKFEKVDTKKKKNK